jgi:hypothetical protein
MIVEGRKSASNTLSVQINCISPGVTTIYNYISFTICNFQLPMRTCNNGLTTRTMLCFLYYLQFSAYNGNL